MNARERQSEIAAATRLLGSETLRQWPRYAEAHARWTGFPVYVLEEWPDDERGWAVLESYCHEYDVSRSGEELFESAPDVFKDPALWCSAPVPEVARALDDG